EDTELILPAELLNLEHRLEWDPVALGHLLGAPALLEETQNYARVDSSALDRHPAAAHIRRADNMLRDRVVLEESTGLRFADEAAVPGGAADLLERNGWGRQLVGERDPGTPFFTVYRFEVDV